MQSLKDATNRVPFPEALQGGTSRSLTDGTGPNAPAPSGSCSGAGEGEQSATRLTRPLPRRRVNILKQDGQKRPKPEDATPAKRKRLNQSTIVGETLDLEGRSLLNRS
jgi:hypothetical protein